MSLGKTITLSNGAKLPQIGLGTWLSKPNEVENAVRRFPHRAIRAVPHSVSRSKSLSATDIVTSISP